MASFTDNVQALTDFKPYISQAPIIEEMSIVGREKQAKYDEGIQKIQGQIDTVAGMDVVRDVDKQYLQQALNQLGGNLRKVAAGDFSNYQLVNSVGGMIGQIGKDTNIQNAVGSTMKYRKGVAAMETAIKEGKSSPSNEYVFQRQANQWLNDGNVKSSFNGAYKPYTNWKKNGIELLKALTKSENISDDAFIGVDNKGNPILRDATIRRKVAGIPPEQIQQALMSGLTPADFEQMQIDGVYSYANVDTPTFMKNVMDSGNSTIKHYTDQRTILQNAKSNTTSVPEKTKLDAQIAELDKTIRSVTQDYRNISELAQQGNGDAAKAQYYTRNAIDGFSRAFSYTETSETYQGKTPQEMEMWRQDKAQDWAKFKANYDLSKSEYNLKLAEFTSKNAPVSTEGGVAKPVNQEDVPSYNLDKVVVETKALEQSITDDKTTFLNNKQQDEKWYNQQYKAWKERPSALPGDIAKHFAKIANKERELYANLTAISDITKQAESKYGSIDKLIPDEEGVTVWDENAGGYLNFTPKDIVKYNTKSNEFIKYTSDNRGKLSISYDYDKAQEKLTPKEYKIFEAFVNNKSPEDKRIVSAIQDYTKRVNIPYKETLDKIEKYTADEITKRITTNQAVGYGMDSFKPEHKNRLAHSLQLFAEFAQTPNGIANSPKFDVETAKKLALDPNTIYTIDVQEGTTRDPQSEMYKITALGKDGEVTFNMTPEQKRARFGRDFEASPAVLAIRPYQEQIRLNGGYTTNLNKGDSNHNTAYLNNNDFSNVKNYGISGDLVQDESGDYVLQINIYDPISGRWYDNIDAAGNNTIPEGMVLQALKGLTDAQIYEILTETPPTANNLKQVEKASKKPL